MKDRNKKQYGYHKIKKNEYVIISTQGKSSVELAIVSCPDAATIIVKLLSEHASKK